MSILCQGQVQFESINLAYLVDCNTYFAKEMSDMQTLIVQGLVVIDDAGIQVTVEGWFFVRTVAMLFDRYLQSDRDRARFSKII
jgi:oxygen-independent coproporphyrinogen-3 oxidase